MSLPVIGIHGYEESWPPFFEYVGTAGQFDIDELTVSAGDDVAFARAILLVLHGRGHRREEPGRVRLSVGLRKTDGEWTIVHRVQDSMTSRHAPVGDGPSTTWSSCVPLASGSRDTQFVASGAPSRLIVATPRAMP